MKLSDLIFESQILLEDKFEIRKTPNGRMWGVYNTTVTPNVLISSHKTKNQANIKADQLRNPTPPKPQDDSGKKSTRGDRNKSKTPKFNPSVAKVESPNLRLAKGMFMSGEGRWTIIFPDGKAIVDVTDERQANRLQRHIENLESQGKSPKEITQQFDRNRSGFLAEADVDSKNVEKFRRNPISRNIKKMNITQYEEYMKTKSGSKWTSWIQSSRYQSFKSFVTIGFTGIIASHIAMLLGIAAALHDIEEEIAQGGDKVKLQEEANILRGQMIILSGSLLVYALKDLKFIKSKIAPFRRLLRGALTGVGALIGLGAGAVVGTSGGPAGTIAGGALGAAKGSRGGRIVGILLGEASSYLVLAVLAMPPVQRFIASVFQGWWFGDLLALAGGLINQALLTADEALDGRFGTGFLADKLATEEIKKEGPDGEYFSDSEWAKLVFGALLFPDGEKTKFVPYMPESKREDMMNALLLPDNSQQNVDAAIDQKMDSDNPIVPPVEQPVA